MRWRRLPFALALALVVLPPPARAMRQSAPGGGTPGTSSNFELVGHDPRFGRSMNAALAFHGGLVYNRTAK